MTFGAFHTQRSFVFLSEVYERLSPRFLGIINHKLNNKPLTTKLFAGSPNVNFWKLSVRKTI